MVWLNDWSIPKSVIREFNKKAKIGYKNVMSIPEKVIFHHEEYTYAGKWCRERHPGQIAFINDLYANYDDIKL